MEFYERLSLRAVLWAKMHGLTGSAFETFFQDVMVASEPDFVDVRTHGNLGDLASDGLTLHGGQLFGCYAPESSDGSKTIAKFQSDLVGALVKRAGQFEEFVFVQNDTRGTHPEISVALRAAALEHTGVTFSIMNYRHFRDRLGKLTRDQVEDLLSVQLPLQHHVTVGLEEMEDLLAHLAEQRVEANPAMPLDEVSAGKLVYSDLDIETQAELRDAMRFSPSIDEYYQARIDVTERDEVAARFSAEYQRARAECDGPEAVLHMLHVYLAGASVPQRSTYRAATAVLAFFFATCDIFENAPVGWRPGTGAEA